MRVRVSRAPRTHGMDLRKDGTRRQRIEESRPPRVESGERDLLSNRGRERDRVRKHVVVRLLRCSILPQLEPFEVSSRGSDEAPGCLRERW